MSGNNTKKKLPVKSNMAENTGSIVKNQKSVKKETASSSRNQAPELVPYSEEVDFDFDSDRDNSSPPRLFPEEIVTRTKLSRTQPRRNSDSIIGINLSAPKLREANCVELSDTSDDAAPSKLTGKLKESVVSSEAKCSKYFQSLSSKSKPNVKEHTKQTKAQEPKTKTEGVCSETNNSHASLQKNAHNTVPYVRLIKGEGVSLDKTNDVPSVKSPYDSITVDDVPIVKNLSPNEVSCENTKTDVLHTNSSSVSNSIVTNLDVESVNTDVCSVHPEENPSKTKELEETINKSPIQSKISKDKMSDSSSVCNSSVCDSDCNLGNKSVSGCGKQIGKTSSLVANDIEEHSDEITIIVDHPADSKIAGDDCNYKENETANVPEPESIAFEEANSSENVNSNSDTEENNKSICSVQKEVTSERKEKDEGLLSNRNSDLLSSGVENANTLNISCSQEEEVSSTKIQGQTDPLSETDSSSASIKNDDESMKTRKPGEEIESVNAVEKSSRSRKEPLPHKDINSSFATDSSAETVKQAGPTSPLRLGCQSSVQQNDTTKNEEIRHADNKKRDGLTGPDIPNDKYRLEKDTSVTQSSSGSLLERRHEQIEAVNRRGIVESNEITSLEQQLKWPLDMEIKSSPKTKLCKTSKALSAIEVVCTDNFSDEGKSLDKGNKDKDVLAMTTSKQSIVESEGKTKSTCGGDVSVNEHATGTGIETSRSLTEGKSVLPSKNDTGCETDISDKVSPTSSLLDKKKLEIKAEVISTKKREISERKLIESIKEKCETKEIENAMKKCTVSSEAKSASPSLECSELEPKTQTMSCIGTDINEMLNIGEVSKEHSERTNEDNSNHSSLENTSLEFNSNSKSKDGRKTGETQLAEHPVKLTETSISEKTLVEHANAVKQCDVLEKRSACSSLEKSSVETGIESKSSKSRDNSKLSGSEYVSDSAEISEKPSEEKSILNNVQSCSSSLEKSSLKFDIESEFNIEKGMSELKLTEKATVQKNLSMVQSKVPHCSNSKGNINEAEFLLQVEKYNRTIATKLSQNRCIEGMLKKKNIKKTDDKSDASGDVTIIKVLTFTSSDTNGNGIDAYKEQNLQTSTFSKSRNQDFHNVVLSDELKEIESLKNSQVSNVSEQNSEPENSDYESEALDMSSESSFTLAGTSTASVSNSLRISENDNECDENKRRYDGKINSFLQLGKNQEQNLRGNTDGNVSPDFWADYEDDDEFFTRPRHLSTGKEEREKIDGNELFSFESEQDMVEFTQINHDFWQCLSMDDGEDVGDASAVSRVNMQHVQKTIVPKKSYDITKIKGWRNKQFAVNNNVGSSCDFSRGSCEDENGFESSDRTGEINMKEEKQNNNSEDVQNNDVSNEASSDRHLNKEEQTSGRTSSFSASASQFSSPLKDGVTLNSGKDSPENSEESLLLRMLKQKDKKDNAETSKSLNENKQKPNTISGHRFETTVRPEANGHSSGAVVSPEIPEELNTNSEIHPCDADILIRYISGATLELSYKVPKLVAEEALIEGKEAEIEQMSPQPLLKPIEIPVEPSLQPINGVPNVSPHSLTKSIDDPLVQPKKGGGPKAKTVAEKRKLMERGPKERLKKKKLESTNTRNFSPVEKGSRVLKMKKKHSDVLKPNKFAPLLKSGGIVGLDPNYKYALVGGKAIRLRGTKLPEESDKIEHQVNDEISSQSHVTLLSSSNATKKTEISDNVVSVPSIHEDVKSASLNSKKTDPKLNHESKQRISPQKPKLKLLQRSSSPKPNPVSEKKDSSQGQNLQSEKEIFTAKTLMYGLQVSTGVGYPVHPQAALYLRKLRSMDIVINKTWANFAASVVVTKNDIGVKKPPEKHIIPVKKHVFVPQKKTNTFMRSANNNTVAKGKKTMQAEVICDAVQSEVKLILEQMVECVANREIEDSIIKDDPDAASNTPASDTTAKCTKRSRKRRNRVFRELNRLDVNVIVMGDDNDIRNDYCQQEHCKLGCVCSSINCDPLSITPEHCGNVECMFECSCKDKESPEVPAGSDSGEKCSMLYNTAMQLQNEENRRLAKVEKEFKHTVVQSKNETVVLRGGSKGGGGKQRREIKLPERYRDSVLGKEFAIAELNMISGDSSTNLPSGVSTSGPKRFDKLQFPKYIQVGVSTPKLPRQGYKLTRGKLTEEQKNSLRRERFKVHTIVPYVDKLKMNDLVPLCMDHSLYNCNICFGQKSKHTTLSKGEPEYEKLVHKERSKSRPLANILSHDVFRNSARTNGATINYAVRNNCHCFKEWHKSLLNENKDNRKNVLTEVDPLAECPDPNISDYLTSYPGHFLASGDPQLMSMYSGEDESAGLVITSIESLKPGEFENVDCINESSERSEQEVIERECLKTNPTEAPASTSGILQDILSNKNVAPASMIRMENTYLIPVLPDGSSDIHSTTLEKLISRREMELKDILQKNLPFDLSSKPQGSIQLLNWIDLVEKVKSKLCHLWLYHKRGTVPQLLVTPYILRPNPFCTSINGDFYKLDLRGNMPPLISFLLSEIYWNENLLRNDACYGLLYFERENWVLVGSLIKETISQEAFSNADVQWDHRAKPVIDLSSESLIPDISVQGVQVSTKNISGELARALAVESPADACGQVEKSSESPQALNICRIEQVHTFAKEAAESPDQLASAGSNRGQTISLMTKNAIGHPERSHSENSLKDVQTSNLDIKIASVSTLSHKKSTWNITYGADDEVDSAGEEPVRNTTVENDTELSDSTGNTNKSVLFSEDELHDTVPSTVDIASTACSLNREDPSVNVDVTSAGENDDKHKKSNSSTCEVNSHLFDLQKNAINDESTFDESSNVTKGPERSDKVENTDKSVLLPNDLECDTAHSAQVESSVDKEKNLPQRDTAHSAQVESSADKEKNLPQCDTAHSAQVESSADKEKNHPQSSDKTERNFEETSDQHKEDDSTKTEKNDCSSEKQNFLNDNSHEMDNSNTVTSQVEDKNQASTEINDTALGETNNDDGFLKIVHVEQVDPNVFNCVDDVEDGINIDSSTSNQAGSSHSENISTESRERNIDNEASSFDTASGDVIVTFMAEGKKSSKKRGLTSIQSTVSETYVRGLQIYLPAGNRPVRWFMLNIEKVFDMLHVGHNKSFIRYLQLLRTTKLAISLNKTVRLPLIKDPRDKYRSETEVTQVTESDLPKFGVYAAPPLFTRMFIGPYDLDEEARVSVIKNIGGKLMNILHMDLENCKIEAHIIHSVFRGVLERMRNNKMEKLYDSCARKPHGSKNNLGLWLYTEAYCRGDARNKSRVIHHSRIGGGIEGEGELLSEEQNAATNIKIVSVHGNVRSSDSTIRPDPEIQEGTVDTIPQISLVETIEGPDIEFEKRTVDDTSKMTESVASFETNILKTSHQGSTDARFTVDETSQKAAKDASFETTTSGKTSHQRNTDARFTVDEISQMTADDASFEITASDTISHQKTTDTSLKMSSADKISEITSDDAISVGEKIIQMNSNDVRSQMKVSDARIQLETSDNTIQLEASDAGSSCNNHVKTTVTSTHLEISNTTTQIPATNTAIPSIQLDTSDTTAQTTIDKDQLISSDAVDTLPQRRSSTNRRKQVLELRSGDELVEENEIPSEDLATEHLSLNLDSTAVNSSLKNKPIGPKPVFAHEDYNLPATHFVNVPDWADGNYSLITNEEDDQEETLDVETPCNSVAMFRQVHLAKNRSSSATIPRVSSSPRKKAAPASKASRMIGKTGVPIRLIPNVQEVGYVTASMFHNKSVLLDDPFTTTPEPSYFQDLKTATRWLTDKLKSVVAFNPPDLPFRWKVRQSTAKHNCKRLNPELLETMTLTSEGLVRKQVSTQSSSAAIHSVPGKEEPSDEESDDHGRTPVPVVIQQTSEMKGLVEKGKREIPDLQAHAQNEKRRRQEILDGFRVLTNLLLSEDEKKLLGNKFSVLKMAEREINRLHKEEQRLKIEYKLEKQRRMNTFREFIRQANVLPDAEDMKREMMNYITRELKTRKRPALPQTKDYHKPLPRPFKKRKRSSGPSKTGKPSHTNSSNIEVVDVTSSSSSSISEYLSDGKSSEEPITSRSDDCKKPERKKSQDVSISLEKSKQRTNRPAAAASEKNNYEDDDGDVDDDVIVTRIIPPKNNNSLLRAGRFPPEVIIEPQKKLSVPMSSQVLPNSSDDYKCLPSDKTVNNVVDKLEGFRGFETTLESNTVGKNIGNLSPKPSESEGFIKLYEKLMHDEKLTYTEKLMQAEKLIQAENASSIDRLCLRLTDRDLMRSYNLNKTQENRMDSSSEAKDWNYLDLKQIVENKSHSVHDNKIMFIRDNVTLSRSRDILPINLRNLEKCGNKNTDSITKVKGIGFSGPELPHLTVSELIPLHGTVNTIPEVKEDIEPFDIEKLPIFFEGTDIQNSLEDNININDNDFRAFTTLLEPEARTTETIEMKPSEITPNSHVSRIADVVAFKRKISKNSDCQVMDRDDWKPAPKVRIFPKTWNANPITTTTKTLIRQFPLLSTTAKLTPLNTQVYGSRIVYSIPSSKSASSHTVTECSSSAMNSKTALTSTITRPVTTGTSSGGAIMKALGPTGTSGSKAFEINTETATAVSSAVSSSKPIGSKLDKKDLFMKFMTLKPGQLVPSLTKWGSPMGKVSMTHLGATNKVTVSNIGTLHPSTSEEATKSTESQPASSSSVKGAIPTTVVAVNKAALSTSQLVFPLSTKCVTVADGKKMFSSTSKGITLKPVPSTSSGITLRPVPSTSTGITLKSVPSTSTGITLKSVPSTSGGIKLRPVSSTSVSMCGNNLLNLKGRKNYVICSKEELYGKPKGRCERIPIVVTSTSSQKSLSLLKHLTQGAREGQSKVKVPGAAVKNLGSGATLTSSSSKLTAHTNPTATLLASRPSISVQKSLLENSAIKITPHVLNFSNLMEKIKYTNRMKVQKKEPKSIEKILNFSSISESASTKVSDSDRTDNTEENNSIVDEEKNIASTNQDAKKEKGLSKTDNTSDSNSKNQTKLTRKRTLNVDEASPNQEHKKVIRAGKSKDSNKNKVTRSERHLRVKDEQSSKGSVSTSSESSQANASERIQNKKSNSVKRTKVIKLLNKKKNLKEGVKRTLVGRRPIRMVTRSKLKKKKHTECCK